MSADNWTLCPKCAEKGPNAKAQAIKNAQAQYGKIAPEDYLRLINEANAMADDEPKETLREDYQIGVWKGKFKIYYGCSCAECGFTFNYKFSKKLNED